MGSGPGDASARSGAGRGWAPYLAAALAAAAAGLVACANQQPPPGTLPDTRPPQVAHLEPGADTVVPGFDGPVRIRFDEPVNLPGDLSRQLLASPAYRYEVETGFSAIEIEPEGGWREGVVYCFELPAGIADLLRNRLEEPIEFCFSTGPPIADTRVAGVLLDRMTMSPVSAGRVLFIPAEGDSTPYTAETVSAGEFSRRALPPGTYWAFGFQDRNRNLTLDRRLEPYDSLRFDLGAESVVDSLVLAWIEPDSTAPVLAAVEVADARTLRLLFDDALDPEAEAGAEVTVRDSATGRAWPVARVRVGEPEAPPSDTAAIGGDTAAVAPDSPAVAADTSPAAASPAGGRRLPARVVAVRLAEPLTPGAYRVSARGFENLWGLTGGGDTLFTYAVPPDTAGPPPEVPAAPDTSAAPADTGAAGDTLAAPADTGVFSAGTESPTDGVASADAAGAP